MMDTVRAYISTWKPWKSDPLPLKLRKIHKGKYAYGIRVHYLGKITDASSWAKSGEPLSPQMMALHCLLSAIEANDLDVKIEVILRREHLRTRLVSTEARILKKQNGINVDPMKDEELWETTTLQWKLYEGGIRLALNDAEVAELMIIEKALKDSCCKESSLFDSSNPPELFLNPPIQS